MVSAIEREHLGRRSRFTDENLTKGGRWELSIYGTDKLKTAGYEWKLCIVK